MIIIVNRYTPEGEEIPTYQWKDLKEIPKLSQLNAKYWELLAEQIIKARKDLPVLQKHSGNLLSFWRSTPDATALGTLLADIATLHQVPLTETKQWKSIAEVAGIKEDEFTNLCDEVKGNTFKFIQTDYKYLWKYTNPRGRELLNVNYEPKE